MFLLAAFCLRWYTFCRPLLHFPAATMEGANIIPSTSLGISVRWVWFKTNKVPNQPEHLPNNYNFMKYVLYK